jgi:hypothetical protein
MFPSDLLRAMAPVMEAVGNAYPAGLQIDSPDRMARWRPLVQWLLALPHLLILYALGILSQVVGLISWFIVVITGKLPASLAGIQAMYLRYVNRVMAYQGFLMSAYPPFSFDTASNDPGDYTGEMVDFEPKLEGRNRLTTFFRIILVIPHAVILVFLGIAAFFAWLVGFFAVLFTARWPESLRRFVIGYMRWELRVNAYWLLLTDEYPPFSLS